MRLGTAEFYRVVEELPEIADSLVVHLEDPAGGNGELILFVVVRPPRGLDDDLVGTVRGCAAPNSRRGTCPTGSSRCRRCRAT